MNAEQCIMLWTRHQLCDAQRHWKTKLKMLLRRKKEMNYLRNMRENINCVVNYMNSINVDVPFSIFIARYLVDEMEPFHHIRSYPSYDTLP